MSQTVLIAGCGFVGIELGRQLAADGAEVLGLRRDVGEIPAPIRAIAADMTRAEELDRALPAHLDAVVFLGSASGGSDRYHEAYVAAPRCLFETLARRGTRPSRVLFASSTGVYGQSDGAWVDEDSPADAAGSGGPELIAGEAIARAHHPESSIVRFSGLYGPGRRRTIDQVREGRASAPTAPPVWTNRIHRDDAAGFLAHLLGLEAPEPLYVASDDEPVARHELLTWLAHELGAPPPGSGPSAPPRSNKRCRNARLRRSGYELRFPTFREGYRALIDSSALVDPTRPRT